MVDRTKLSFEGESGIYLDGLLEKPTSASYWS